MKKMFKYALLINVMFAGCNNMQNKVVEEWYVFREKGTAPTPCIEHKGKTIVGGSIKYVLVKGPFASEQKAKDFSNTCDDCLQ